MTMVERVARAICERHVKLEYGLTTVVPNGSQGWVRDIHRELARAAIEAMIEPTPGMVRAAVQTGRFSDERGNDFPHEADSVWNAMISAALEEKE